MGLSNKEVMLMEYSEGWKKEYEKESKYLKKILDGYYISIQHVGSTSIPGICAKPIIDIAIGVASERMMQKVKDQLVKYGYYYCSNAGDINRIFVAKGSPQNRTHNIHIEIYEGEAWHNHIDFREALIRQPKYKQQYCELKKYLAVVYKEDRLGYTLAKDEFIKKVIKLEGDNRL